MRGNLFYPMGCLFRLGWIMLVLIAVIALVRHFVFDIMPVSGASMDPNFQDKDVIVLNKISYATGQPRRGDSVVLRFPGDPDHARYIKRIIGLPGEQLTIRGGSVFVNNEPLFENYIADSVKTFPSTEVTLKANEYFLLGDNRPISSDSRIWGTATKDDFIGKAFYIVFPFKNLKPVPQPVY